MKAKPTLYIDVDGVLFGKYDDMIQLRPSVLAHLKWFNQNFRCRWLTTWDLQDLKILFSKIYGSNVFSIMGYTRWHDNNKTTGIDFSEEFFWIEDGITPEEEAVLRERGVYESYIFVDPVGEHELLKTRSILGGKLLEELNP